MKAPFFLFLLSITTSGCVVVDTRSLTEDRAPDSLNNISGQYNNTASYKSETLGFNGPEHFSELLDPDNTNTAETFQLILNTPNHLAVKFENNGKTVSDMAFIAGNNLKINTDGIIEIGKHVNCDTSHDFGLDCIRKDSTKISLYLNPEGDLVVVQLDSMFALTGIYPIAIMPVAKYIKLVAIFPRSYN